MSRNERILFGLFFCFLSFTFTVYSLLTVYLYPAIAFFGIFAWAFVAVMYEATQINSVKEKKII